MPSATDFDFSGNYAFISSEALMHRLDESILPLLKERGGRICRIYTDATPRTATGDFPLSALPADFFHTQAVRAVFCTDNATPPGIVPKQIPLIAIPHASWRFGKQGPSEYIERVPSYLSNCDYYLAPGRAKPLCIKIASLRQHDGIHILPFGNLKIDELRRRWIATPHKTNIFYCCGQHQNAIPIESKSKLIDLCLQHFPQYDFILRPFPGERPLYDSLADAFRYTKRFRIDSSRSMLQKIPEAVAVLADNNSTTGHMFSLATGRPAVILASPGQKTLFIEWDCLPPVCSPETAISRLKTILARQDSELPELTAMRETYLFRPGHARELFFTYLMQILSGTVPQEAVTTPCEYIGDLQLDSPTAEISFFLQVLRTCRVEFYYSSLQRFRHYAALQNFYQKLYEGRVRRNIPAMLIIQEKQGRKYLLIPSKTPHSFFLPASLSEYSPATKTFIQQNRALLRAQKSLGRGIHILLPDRDKAVFCHALASVIAEVYGLSSPA